MKKKIAVLVIVAFLGAWGCCTSPDNSNKNVFNCVKKFVPAVQKIICGFSAEQIQQAGDAAVYLTSILNQSWSEAVARARDIFLDIRAGICVTPIQLQTSLGIFDGEVIVASKQAAAKGTVASAPPDVSALRKLLKK